MQFLDETPRFALGRPSDGEPARERQRVWEPSLKLVSPWDLTLFEVVLIPRERLHPLEMERERTSRGSRGHLRVIRDRENGLESESFVTEPAVRSASADR